MDENDALVVNVIWGVKDLDRSDVTMWDPSNLGKLVWDDSFTVSPAENQRALLDFCDYLRTSSPIVFENEVECWIEEFDSYVQKTTSGAHKLPIGEEDKFDELLEKFAFDSEQGQLLV